MSQKFKAGNKRAYWINISVHKTKMLWNASISLSPSLCQPNFASRFSTAYPIFSVTSLAQPLHLTHSIISLHVEVVALIIVCDVNRVRCRSRIPFVGARYTPVLHVSQTFRRPLFASNGYSNRKDTAFRFTVSRWNAARDCLIK